jgi:hypothetical protein
MRCLMDKVNQQKDVGLVMDFVYEASNLFSGQQPNRLRSSYVTIIMRLASM